MSAPTAAGGITVADKLSPNSKKQLLYRLRLAGCMDDVRAAQRLRFQVFNVELGEGLASAYENGLDQDGFDEVCDHLLVEDIATGELAGTYRLQTGSAALQNRGFYSAQEFDFTPYRQVASEIVELGRACVHRQHRNLVVLGLLWKGIAAYATQRGGKYLIGCSSLTSQDPQEGVNLFHSLEKHLAPQGWRTEPMPGFECFGTLSSARVVRPPKLMSAYISIGAKICGPPALDSEFKTIDFLTLLKIQDLPESIAARYELNR